MERCATSYVINNAELHIFMSRLEAIQVPIGYCCAIAKHVTTKKLSGMKAHDWHVVMQQLLPLCIRGLLLHGPRIVKYGQKMLSQGLLGRSYKELQPHPLSHSTCKIFPTSICC